MALIAAKSYYFGVGGSVADFCALVQADHRFACESVRTSEDWQSNLNSTPNSNPNPKPNPNPNPNPDQVRTFEDGQSNRREVLQVRWRDAPAANVDQSMVGA
tara:strand:- start:203 stop:508 length:306 start_codon:yes stop_codon:yes gene_type:complete